MMKKYILFCFIIVGVVGFSGCLKSKEDPYEQAQEQLDRDEEIIKKFIADNNIEAVRHESGVYYQIITPGSGNHMYTASSVIEVKYTGRLLNGTVFDKTENTTYTSQLGKTNTTGGLILGWQIGVPLIQEGGKIRLLIPSLYAYGNSANGIIPANAVLDFDIELIDIK